MASPAPKSSLGIVPLIFKSRSWSATVLRGLFSPGTGVEAGEDVLRRGANGGIVVAVLAGSEASRLRFGDGLIVEMAVCGIFVSRMGKAGE